MLVHRRVTPYITHLYTWVEGGTVRVKYLTMYPREHNVTGHGLNPDHLMQSQVRTLIITPLFLQDSIFSPEYDKNFNRVYST